MIRPSLQARRKLIFLYLLRSSSALATSEPPLNSKQSSIITSNYSPHGHITLRLATRMDVPAIQRCNLATLPENYSSNFYVNHLRQWPDLALVAEHVVDDDTTSKVTGRNPFETFDPCKPQNEIVGYVLGKVEETEVTTTSSSSLASSFSALTRSRIDDSDEYFANYLLQRGKTEMLGHVTSLAVLPQFRRKGLAAQLMKQLHFHMEQGYNADGVGLHVRVSNVAARRLYCEGMGYGVVDVIRGYYQDGEDAFFMRKNFHSERNSDKNTAMEKESNSSFGRFGLRRKKRNNNASDSISNVWECGPVEYRLPRILPLEQPEDKKRKHTSMNSRSTASQEKNVVDDPSQDQVMTGSF